MIGTWGPAVFAVLGYELRIGRASAAHFDRPITAMRLVDGFALWVGLPQRFICYLAWWKV